MSIEIILSESGEFRAQLHQALEGPVRKIIVTLQPDHPLLVEKQQEALTLTKETFIEPHGPLSNPCRERVIPENIRFVPLWATFKAHNKGIHLKSQE